jgi:cyclopropane fatty-acyl-phospholipid synthase-like methyltransferase
LEKEEGSSTDQLDVERFIVADQAMVCNGLNPKCMCILEIGCGPGMMSVDSADLLDYRGVAWMVLERA